MVAPAKMRRRLPAALLAALALAGGVAGVVVADHHMSEDPQSISESRLDAIEREIASRADAPLAAPAPMGWVRAADRIGAATVNVRAIGGAGDPSQGTGVIVSGRGEVLTADHVIRDDKGAPRREIWLDLDDGRSLRARIVGRAPGMDVALLSVAPGPDGVPGTATLSRAPARVGEPVAVYGGPFGHTDSLSVGVVSGRDRDIASADVGFRANGAIQTDAAINRGNSGGPLIDRAGRVIGIVVQLESEGAASSGVGFAISSQVVDQLLPRLRQGGEVRAGYLGLATVDLGPTRANALGIARTDGALVQRVEPGSPAADAGLVGPSGTERVAGEQIGTGGDLVVALDGEAISSAAALSQAASLLVPGREVSIDVIGADGDRRSVRITPAARPAPDG